MSTSWDDSIRCDELDRCVWLGSPMSDPVGGFQLKLSWSSFPRESFQKCRSTLSMPRSGGLCQANTKVSTLRRGRPASGIERLCFFYQFHEILRCLDRRTRRTRIMSSPWHSSAPLVARWSMNDTVFVQIAPSWLTKAGLFRPH